MLLLKSERRKASIWITSPRRRFLYSVWIRGKKGRVKIELGLILEKLLGEKGVDHLILVVIPEPSKRPNPKCLNALKGFKPQWTLTNEVLIWIS